MFKISDIGILSGILFKLLELSGFKYLSNHVKAQRFVEECLRHAKIIIEAESFPNETANYSHEVVKKLYNSASEIVGDVVGANDLSKIMQALSAARIYYWVRHFDGKPGEDIIELLNERLNRIKRRSVRHNSYEWFVQKIKDTGLQNPNLVEQEILNIKYNSLADIAELEELVLNVVISKKRKQ